MGTHQFSLKSSSRRGRRNSFRRLFVRYFLGVLIASFLVTCVLGLFTLVLVALYARYIGGRNIAFELGVVLFALALPCIVLFLMALLFAWRVGHRLNQPVSELMQAVEKIRRQDLDFFITYRENNELGDLCIAFNELRRELQGSLEREWRKQEEMRTMIAALSHDLRTPVTIIQGHIEGLARVEAGERRQQRLERYLPVLAANSRRMTRLLNDILLVSVLEQASFIVQPQPVQLEEEMERKAQVYALQAAACGIDFGYAYHHCIGQEGPVKLDLHRLEQVLDNLFENALRYTPACGTISLNCTRDERALTFVLRDTGRGIAPADLPHIFEKFYQGAPRPGEKARKAAGLGLYTCKLLVEKHSGTIALYNHPCGGCEVTVCVPTSS